MAQRSFKQQCDVCNEVYVGGEVLKNYYVKNLYKGHYKVKLGIIVNDRFEQFNLCPECTEKLVKFMENRKD